MYLRTYCIYILLHIYLSIHRIEKSQCLPFWPKAKEKNDFFSEIKAGSFWQPLWRMSKKSHHTDTMPVGSGFPLRGFSLYLLCYLFSTRIYDLLLMVQKNKLLGCIKPNEYWDIYHINWLPGMSSIKSISTHVRCLELQPPGPLLLLAEICGTAIVQIAGKDVSSCSMVTCLYYRPWACGSYTPLVKIVDWRVNTWRPVLCGLISLLCL